MNIEWAIYSRIDVFYNIVYFDIKQMLLMGIPWESILGFVLSDNMFPIHVLKFLLVKKLWVCLLTQVPLRSLITPYFHVLAYAFSRLKNIATICSFLMNVSCTKVSGQSRWYIVLLLWIWFGGLRIGSWSLKYYFSLVLTILLLVVYMQLVRTIGL